MPFCPTSWASGVSPYATPIVIDTTQTGAPGTSAQVTNTSSDPNLISLRFTVPRGDVGATGAQGAQGIQGIQGVKGDTGDTGAQGAQGIQGIQGVKGDTGDTGATGPVGPQGDNGSSTSLLYYRAEPVSQSPPPPASNIRWNQVSQTTATFLYVSHLDDSGDDVERVLELCSTGSTVLIQDRNQSGNFQSFVMTGPAVNTTGSYVTFPVSFVNGGGTGLTGFQNNHAILLGILYVGPQGPVGPMGPAGPVGATGAQGIQGIQGIQGVKGDTGDTGATGAQGIQGPPGPAGETNTSYFVFTRGSNSLTNGFYADSYVVISWSNSSNEIYLRQPTARSSVYASSVTNVGGSFVPSSTALLTINNDDYYAQSGTGSITFTIASDNDATHPFYKVFVAFTGSLSTSQIYATVEKFTPP